MTETSNDTAAPAIAPPAPPKKARRWHDPEARRAMNRAALAVVAAVPVVLVNGTAFIGQFAFLHQHVPWILPGQVLFAVALESVAVYLAWHAHIAKMANDSSGRIMLSAYLFALVIAAMNYSHYAGPRWHPTFMSVGLALMSASSPWLWNVHSRRVSRDKLMARGLLEEKAVRLGATRWTWHPVRSMVVTWLATWDGEQNPKAAIAMFADHRAARAADRAARRGARHDESGAGRDGGAPELPSAPETAPLPVPGRKPLEVLQGGAPAVSGKATLNGQAVMTGGKRPDFTQVQEMVERLGRMPVSDLPSARYIAREWIGNPNQRRLAQQLLDDRVNNGPSAAALPAGAQAPAAIRAGHRQSATSLIANPAAFAPGGAASVNA